MLRIASTVCETASPLSAASRAPFAAARSVWRLLSALCPIEVLISSRDALVSSTAAACSEVPCDSVCAVPFTWVEAEASPSAEARTSATTSESRTTMLRIAASRLAPPPAPTSIEMVRSPSATRLATSAAYSGSPPICRETARATASPAAAAPAAAKRKTSQASRVAFRPALPASS